MKLPVTITQAMAWPSRKKHLFVEGVDNKDSDFSLCGCVSTVDCFDGITVYSSMTFNRHDCRPYLFQPYNDLNYCQSCLRILLAMTYTKYVPLKDQYKQWGVK